MPSIQQIFSSIRIEQVCLYLHRTGWTQSVNGGRLDFEKILIPSEGASRLFLPASSSHPRFRSLLPNLIFSLSILEQREPIEVAGEIASLTTAESAEINPPPLAAGMSGHLYLRNSSAFPIEIELDEGLSRHQLPAGEELLIARAESDCVIEIAAASTIRQGKNCVLLGLPPSELDAIKPVRKWFNQCFPLADTAGVEMSQSSTREEAQRLLGQFCFAVESLADLIKQPATLLRASAVLLCGVSQLLPDHSEGRAELFQLARLLLSPARRTFALKPHQATELWQITRQEQPVSPVATLAWLTQESHLVENAANSP